ncbi:MAG: prolipoprotein diacylglyceryl transferase [Thermomicrobiales bacterium]|nr:prolipoprotein diacylglyceryl transferase [Thermomicrobiales bacterium]
MPSPSDPVAVALFGLEIRWYAVFILLGVLCAIAVLRQLARERHLDPDFPLDVAPWIVLLALLGARLYYLALDPDYYLGNPDQAVNVRLGGLTVHGALAGGALGLYLYCRYRKQRFLTWGDLIIAVVPIGQAIGRWGNWANQEAFGRPTDLPWGVEIDPGRRPPGFENAETFHPTFLYESILDIGIALVLIAIVRRMPANRFWREGDAIWIYMILYGVVRFIIERMRTDSLYIGPWPAAYWVSGGLILAGGVLFMMRRSIWPGAIVADIPLQSVNATND